MKVLHVFSRRKERKNVSLVWHECPIKVGVKLNENLIDCQHCRTSPSCHQGLVFSASHSLTLTNILSTNRTVAKRVVFTNFSVRKAAVTKRIVLVPASLTVTAKMGAN